MAGLIKLREGIHNTLLKMRSIEAMIRRPEFDRLWDDSSEEEQKKLENFIAAADRESVRVWIRDHPSLELAEKKLVELKRIAYQLGITNYSRKGKLELIKDIEEKEKLYGEKQRLHV